MEDKGWIKIHRSLRDNPYMKRPAYRAVWIELLLEANHSPREIIWKGEKIKIQPGQLTCGLQQLSEWTGVSKGSCKRILDRFKSETMIETQTSNRFSLITINNWQHYQKSETQNETPVKRQRNANETPVKPPKECKNVRMKEVKENIYKRKKFLDFVFLTEEEWEKLKYILGGRRDEYIRRLNDYIGSTGKKYKSHYFTLLNWARKEGVARDDTQFIFSLRTRQIESLNPKDYDRFSLLGRMSPEELKKYHLTKEDENI